MTATLCRRAAPAIAVSLCRACGLKAAQAERDRLHRAERIRQAQDRRERRHWQAPAHWTEPEPTQ